MNPEIDFSGILMEVVPKQILMDQLIQIISDQKHLCSWMEIIIEYLYFPLEILPKTELVQLLEQQLSDTATDLLLMITDYLHSPSTFPHPLMIKQNQAKFDEHSIALMTEFPSFAVFKTLDGNGLELKASLLEIDVMDDQIGDLIVVMTVSTDSEYRIFFNGSGFSYSKDECIRQFLHTLKEYIKESDREEETPSIHTIRIKVSLNFDLQEEDLTDDKIMQYLDPSWSWLDYSCYWELDYRDSLCANAYVRFDSSIIK